MEKIDYKKQLKHLYAPSVKKVEIVDVPQLKKATLTLIAPCGINCRLCQRYVRNKKACPGCRGDDGFKTKTCGACRIKNCEKLKEGGFKYCFICDEFSCALVSRLEKRYTANYGVSVLGNLKEIQCHGIRSFVRNENTKWICSKCGELLCMHKAHCISCGHTWRGKTNQFAGRVERPL